MHEPGLITFQLAWGLLALGVAWRRGWLPPRGFGGVSVREPGLQPFDLVIVIGLFFVGQTAFGMLLQSFVPLDEETRTFVYTSVLQQAVLVMVSQMCGYLPSALYLVVRAGAISNGYEKLGFVIGKPGRTFASLGLGLFLGLPIVAATLTASSVLSEAMGYPVPKVAHSLLLALQETDSPAAVALLSISALFFAPVLEELLFRGVLQSVLVQATGARWLSIAATGALFAVVHLGGVPVQALPGLFVLSMLLGYLYERTGSLLAPILAHIVFNALNFLPIALGLI